MTDFRLQLLQTVKNLHEAGTVKLSDQDKARIESETRDLIQRSIRNARIAAKAPEGFEEMLQELKGAEGPDEAYQIVLDFIGTDAPDERDSDSDEPVGGGSKGGDGDEGAPGEGDDDGEKSSGPSKDDKKPEEEGIESSFDKEPDEGGGGKPPSGKKPDEKGGKPSGKGKPPFDKKPDGKGGDPGGKGGKPDEMGGKPDPGMPQGLPEEDEEMRIARRRLIRRAQGQESGGGIADLQEKQRAEGEEESSAEEMGIEDREGVGSDITVSARAAKVRVGITRERNLIAYHDDYGPVFRAVPNAKVKADGEALRRLANKIYGIAVYKGFGVAAALCNASMLKDAGVDEGIMTDSQVEIGPETDGILADAETDTREKPEEGDSSSLQGNEVDTREKPPTVSDVKTKMIANAARRKRFALDRAKRRRGKDILDEAENVTKTLKPSKPSGDTGDEATFNSQETPGTPRGDVLVDEDNDIRTANLNELYRHRLEKKLAAEKEQFVRKFTRALRVASTRMLLNHEEHPMKSAAVDVLTAGDIEFTDGQRFTGMDMGTALELTELIAAEGHDRFMAQMLSRAADLLAKDDRYLADAESDLKDQAPIPVGDGEQATARKRSSRNRRSSRVRREAAEGNFAVTENGPPVSGPGKVSGGVRDALSGGTLLGRRIGRFQG